MKEPLKAAARAVALVAALPWILAFLVKRPILGADRAVESSTQSLAWLPGLVGQYIRRAFLRQAIAHCATSAAIEYGVLISQAGARIAL